MQIKPDLSSISPYHRSLPALLQPSTASYPLSLPSPIAPIPYRSHPHPAAIHDPPTTQALTGYLMKQNSQGSYHPGEWQQRYFTLDGVCLAQPL